MSFPLRSAARSALGVGLSLWCVACGGEGNPPPEKTTQTEATREFVVPGTGGELPADDPGADGWDSEARGVAVSAVMKSLCVIMMSGEGLAEKAAALQDNSFEVAAVVPASRTEEIVSAGISVFSAVGDPVESTDLGEALRAMLGEAGFSGPPERAETKIVSVEREDKGLARCRIVFQIGSAGDSSGRRQLDGEWDSVWRFSDGSSRLVSLRGVGVLTVSALGVFSDITHAALGANRDFPEQFYRGQDHWAGRIEMLAGLDVGGWQGVALADVNGDGRDDIYVSQPGGLPNRLYVAEPDGTFEDISASAGVDFLDSSHASLFADLDNDGDQDLIAGASHGELILENNGAGVFTEKMPKLLPAALPYSIAAADIDADGDLDFYVCCYNRRPGVNRHHVFARPVPYHDANNGGRNALFRNDGNWRFTDITVPSGTDTQNRRFSYAAAWEDYDNDGDLDLYVANDFGRNNLYRNDTPPGGAPRFTEVAEDAGVVDVGPGMSACWGDYDDDGSPDLYVGNMFSSAGHRVTSQPQFHRGAEPRAIAQFRRHARGNSLFNNRGSGGFEDESIAAGVTLGRWAWGSKFVDLNSDGRLDIVVANGFISQDGGDDL